MTRRGTAEALLGTKISMETWEAIKREWPAFAHRPSKYSHTITLDIINRWLKEVNNHV